MDQRLYSIPPLSEALVIAENRGETTFTVTNATDRPLSTEIRLEAAAPVDPAWFDVERPLRVIPPRGVEQVKVTLTAPPEAAGEGSFTVVAIWRDRPDEFFTKGPAVGCTFTPTEAPPEPSGSFPIWIVIVAAVVVLSLGGVATWYFWPNGDPAPPEEKVEALVAVPPVRGMHLAEAVRVLKEAGLGFRRVAASSGTGAPGTVTDQNPRPGIQVRRGTAVQLAVR
jgi:hypothetical protein